MKKFPLFCLLALVCASPALAQNGYRYDNFDAPNGVRVADVPTRSVLPSISTVRKTAHVNSSSAEGVTITRPAPLLYTQPRTTQPSAMAASRSLDGFTTGDARIDAYIVEAGVRNGVDPVLLYATMHQESSFKQRAVSPKGARGLMQLMPGTARRFGVMDIFDPRQNIEGGARYMRFLLDSFGGDVSLALAGYNAGEGAVLKYGRQIPPYRETQEYVRRITRRYALLRDPQTTRDARLATPTQVAEVQTARSTAPLSIYERNVYAVRLPDGRLQLVSQ
ncbi:MAG TPA: lytic transglycosylase domain-containing protein [Pyrinomonadaceae bacterium]|jgi:soluble lytic murein transglycosylase-like protein